MLISMHKLMPLVAAGTIAHHSRDAIDKRLASLNFSPRQFVAKRSMKNILYSIQLRTIGEFQVKFEPDVKTYLRGIAVKEAGDPSKDPWGTTYKLYTANNQVFIVTAGPDKQFNTKDDIQRSAPILNY